VGEELMGVNRTIQKVRLKADRRYHDSLVRDLFDDPGLLHVEGLVPESTIWKTSEYHFMHGTTHKEEGRYEVFPASDLVFFYAAGSLNFLVVEVKGNLLGKSHVDAVRQLDRALSYFTGFWKAVIVNEVKPSLLNRLGEFSYKDVFLSLAEVTREHLTPEYVLIPYHTGLYLGKMMGSPGSYRVHFADEQGKTGGFARQLRWTDY